MNTAAEPDSSSLTDIAASAKSHIGGIEPLELSSKSTSFIGDIADIDSAAEPIIIRAWFSVGRAGQGPSS